MSYPTENIKGRYIFIVWAIFNLGGVLGGLAAMGINYNNPSGSANSATYFALAAVMMVGSLSAFIILIRPEDVCALVVSVGV